MVEKSLRPKARPKGLGLDSTRPRSRPLSDEEGMAIQEAAAVEQAKSLDQMRQFGNLEFRADMDEQLKWNPLARLGFEPDQSVVGRPRYNSPDIHEGIRYPYYAEQEYIDETLPGAASGVEYTDVAERVKPGSVVVNSNTAKNPVWSHEYTHGGLEKVIEYLNEDREFFTEKYGKDTVKLLDAIQIDTDRTKGPNEKLTEMLDDVSKDAEVDIHGHLIPAAGTALGGMDSTRTAVEDVSSRASLQEYLKKGRVNDNLSGRASFEASFPGYSGIFKAAEDMLEKQGETLPSEKRGWWEQKANRWLSGKGLFNEGGDVASQTRAALLDSQRDERKLGAGLTSLEFEADMMPLLKKDPIAMLGYKASIPNRRFPSIQKMPENNTPLYYDVSDNPVSPNYNPSRDKIGYGRDYGSSKDVILHELRHRGLKVLEEKYKEKDSFIADYGDMAYHLLDKADISGSKSNEFVVELYDNPDATYIKPGASGSKNTIGYVSDTLQFVDPNSDTQVMPDVADELLGIALSSEDHNQYRSLVDNTSISEEEIARGKSGLDKAAKDLLTEIGVLGFNKGGDVASQTEEALGWTAEGKKFADENPVEVTEEKPAALSIADVPAFDRPMDASESDKWTGVQDELGNRQYKTIFGRTYFVRPADDQRTNYEKIQQDIIPTVKNYLDNPTAPSREQTIDFLKQSLGAAWETFKIPGDLAAGNKGMEDVTLGNIFELAGGTGVASTVGKVPDGDSSNTTRIFGGVGMEGAGTNKAFKKAKKLLKKLRSKDYSPFPPDTGAIDFNINKEIWEQTNWYVDPNDGQWRFYIDDSKSELKPFKEAFKVDPEAGLTFKELSEKNIPRENSKSVLLKNFFDHTDLYKKYPELEELNVGFYSNPGSRILGSADSKNNTIYLNLSSYENYEDMKSVVLHEIQHIVQEKEGFVPGANERSIPPELVKKQEMEIATKIKPDVNAKAKLEGEERAVKFQIREELKDAETPIPGLTAKQEQEIFKIKSDDGGPSWASLGRKYGVPTRAVQKAWGRVNLLNYLQQREKELNLALTVIESNLFSAGLEMSNIEFEFYQGAGGEIESRLVQAMASGEKGLANDGFPVSVRNSMLGKEGNKYQYRGKEGVDPIVYTNQPRKDPDQKSFLDKLKSKVGASNSSELKSNQVRRYRDDLDPEVYDAFDELAEIQRGAPEIAMTSAQRALEGGVLSYALEHTGDLTHRMAEKGGVYGTEYVKPKVNRLLDSLLSEYGFEKEHLENLKNTAQFNYDKLGKNTDLSFEQYYQDYVDNAQEKIKTYAEEHKKVPVYNDMQLAGREAAIAIGEGRYTDAVEHLYLIKSAIDDGTYRQKSVEFNPKIDFRKEPDQGFAQGGVVNDMNKQMKMFAVGGIADDGLSRDPVSGNEIPPGSLAEEVRDDIPAQLSEGEYVVPADVVRFFGVKFFEDLRTEAKMGLSNMEANGRIGGEPVQPQMAQAGSSPEISDQDLAQLEQMLSTGVANGGLMDKLVFAAKNDRVINQRLNAGGVVVGYAGGGQVATPTASYADPNRVDAVISRIMTAVQQKPELLQELSKRGIQVSRTNPNMRSKEMDQANPPQEATKAFALGGFNTPGNAEQAVNPSTGLPSWASTPGGSYTYQGPNVPSAPVTSVDQVEAVGVAPASTAQEACTAMGMGYDPITGTCILVNNDDSGPVVEPETPEFKFEEPDVDYFKMSEEELAAIGTGAKIDPLMNKLGLGAALVSGPLGLLVGGYNAYQQGKAISEVRSAALVAKARGFDDLADTLRKQADDLVGKSSFLIQAANTFGGLSGINDFSQQIAAFSPKDFNVGLNLKMFDGDEKAYRAAIRGADEAISKRGVSTAKEQRARLSDPIKLKEARDKAAAYKAEKANKKPTVVTASSLANNDNNTAHQEMMDSAMKQTTDVGGHTVTERTYGGDTYGADEDGAYKGGLMTKKRKKK